MVTAMKCCYYENLLHSFYWYIYNVLVFFRIVIVLFDKFTMQELLVKCISALCHPNKYTHSSLVVINRFQDPITLGTLWHNLLLGGVLVGVPVQL